MTTAADNSDQELPAADDMLAARTPTRTIGRYVILELLHRSAAAEVYKAYDPELDRKVAIKLLAVQRWQVAALAQVAHPHLIPVHDVGSLGERVFIAMEFIGGGTLTAWLGQRPQRGDQILQHFLDAGAGLLAAHAQGLAHRSFGATEVLIDGGGRVRVLGLYRPVDAAAQAQAVQADLRAFITALRSALAPVDAATPSGRSGIPAPVRRTLARTEGLLARQENATLATLLRDLHRRPRWPRLVAVSGLAAVALLCGALYGHKQATMCRGADAQVAPLFDRERAEAIHRAFLHTDKPYAEDAFAGVQRAVAEYLPRWTALYQQACEDTRRGRQPEAVRDLRLACLDQQRTRLDHLFTLFAAADDKLVLRAVPLVRELADRGSLDGCSDLSGLRAQAPPPADAALVTAIAAVRRDLARSDALQRAGRYPEGLHLATQITAHAVELPYLPIQAEAFFKEAFFHSAMVEHAAAEQLLRRAIWAAEASHHDRVAAQAWLQLLFLQSEQVRIREGHEDGRHAAAALLRCTGCADLWAQWHEFMGDLSYAETREPEALAHYQEALAERQQRLPPMSMELARSYNNLGSVYTALERPDEALRALEQARLIVEHEIGHGHPSVAVLWSNIAVNQQNKGLFADSLRSNERALRIRERVFGPAHISVGNTLGAMGQLLTDMRRYPQAEEYLLRALPIVQKELGAQSPRAAYILYYLGDLKMHMHLPKQALAYFAAALKIREATLPPEHLDLSFSLVGVSRALIELHRPSAALPLVQRALRICAGASAPNAETLAGAEFALALVRWQKPVTRREAHQLAEQARAAYATLGSGFAEEHAEVEQWQRSHPLPRRLVSAAAPRCCG